MSLLAEYIVSASSRTERVSLARLRRLSLFLLSIHPSSNFRKSIHSQYNRTSPYFTSSLWRHALDNSTELRSGRGPLNQSIHQSPTLRPTTASMASPQLSTLESLPLLLLESVCDFLAPGLALTNDLQAFSLASRTCSFASERRRFKHVHLRVIKDEELAEDIDHWTSIFSIDQRGRHVRHLTISGAWWRAPHDYRFLPEDYLVDKGDSFLIPKESSEQSEDGFEQLGIDRWDPPDHSNRETFRDFFHLRGSYVAAKQWRDHSSWRPLKGLIRQLPALRDLTYCHIDHFPTCLLSTLQDYVPNCRLHLHTYDIYQLLIPKFDLRKLSDIPSQLKYSAYELATSPSLCSIVFWQEDSIHRLSSPGKIALALASTAAPRLKEIRMKRGPIPFRPISHGGFPGQPWFDDYLHGDQTRKRPTPLESLMLNLGPSTFFAPWTRYADFARLKSLDITMDVDSNKLRELTTVVCDGALAALRSFTLVVGTIVSAHSDKSEIDYNVSSLLLALPPLTFLSIKGWVDEKTFEAIASHHCTLDNLIFIPTSSYDDIEDVFLPEARHITSLSQLHQLKHLTVHVRRIRGSEAEYDVYRALSTLKSLETAKISLTRLLSLQHLSAHGWSGVSESERDDDEDSLHDCLANGAFDRVLAKNIFNTISYQNNLRRVEMIMRVNEHTFPASPHFQGYVKLSAWVAKRWVGTRDADGVIHLKEMVEPKRPDPESSQIMGFESRYATHTVWKEIWDSVWPSNGTSSDEANWVDRWHSLPLLDYEIEAVGESQEPDGLDSKSAQKSNENA